MPAFVGALTIPPVSEEFIDALSKAFRPFEVGPGFDRDALMQSVGEQKVVEWIKHHARSGRTVTGDAAAIRQVQPNGAIVKLGT
jgi:hypothetical protein